MGAQKKAGWMGRGGGGGGRSHDSRKNRAAKRDSNEPSNQRALEANFGRKAVTDDVRRTSATHEDIHANTALSPLVNGGWKNLSNGLLIRQISGEE